MVVFWGCLGSYFMFWVGCLGFGLCLGVGLGVFFRCLGLVAWIWVGIGLGGCALVGGCVFVCLGFGFRFVYCFGGVLGVWFWGFSVDCLLTLLFVIWRWWFDLDGVSVVCFVLVVALGWV